MLAELLCESPGEALLLVERGRGITCKNKREGREEEGQSIS